MHVHTHRNRDASEARFHMVLHVGRRIRLHLHQTTSEAVLQHRLAASQALIGRMGRAANSLRGIANSLLWFFTPFPVSGLCGQVSVVPGMSATPTACNGSSHHVEAQTYEDRSQRVVRHDSLKVRSRRRTDCVKRVLAVVSIPEAPACNALGASDGVMCEAVTRCVSSFLKASK